MSTPASGQAPESGIAPTDLDLIGRIKDHNDSAATRELVHRHTGIYISVIQQYEGYSHFRARANPADLKEDKFLNIFKWAQTYDPSHPTETGKPMEFGPYVGKMTTYLCKGIISKGHLHNGELTEGVVELDDVNPPISLDNVTDTAERDSALESVREQVETIDEGILDEIANKQASVEKLLSEITALEDDLLNKRVFKDIFNMRYGGKKPMTWRAISAKVNMTHEGARKLFNKHMSVIKERARA